MSHPVIKIEDVHFSYPGTRALRGLSCEIEKGDVLGLLGPNGAGKSTLIHLMNGFMPPSRGTIRILGLDPWKERVELQKRMAYVPEHPLIYSWIKVGGLLAFLKRSLPGWDESYVVERLENYGIALNRRFSTLSRGQKGIVSLVAALGRRSEILLLDDPTLGLDVFSRKNLYETIVEELADREVTILFATHLPAEVEGILTHAAFISWGKITTSGSLKELKIAEEGADTAPSLEDLAIRYGGEANHVS